MTYNVFSGTLNPTQSIEDHPGEPVPEENFWTLWCKGRLTEADTPISGWAPLHPDQPVLTCTIPPMFLTGWMPFLPRNQQRQSTEGRSTEGTILGKLLIGLLLL